MSSVTIDWSEFANDIKTEFISNHVWLSVVFLLFYDFALTLPQEIRCDCSVLAFLQQGVWILSLLVTALFAATRIFAIWNHNWWLFVVVFALGVVEPATNIYEATVTTYVVAPSPLPTCVGFLDISQNLFNRLPLGIACFRITFELAVIGLTIAKTIGVQRIKWRSGVAMPLSTLLLRDGSLYFMVLAAFSIIDIIAGSGEVPSMATVGGFSSMFVPTVTPILLTRFILNLRTVGLDGQDASSTDLSNSTLRFSNRVWGNLGSQLGHGVEDIADDEAGDYTDSYIVGGQNDAEE